MKPKTVALSFCMTLSCLTAQKTWIVDENLGLGAQFADLPPAVQASSSGDTIFVRTGRYMPFTTSKGLRVFGSPGAEWLVQPINHAIIITNLPKGESFLLKGFAPVPRTTGRTIVLRQNLGRVYIDSVDIGEGLLKVTGCDQVSVSNSKIYGGVTITDSTTSVSNCVIVGLGSFRVTTPGLGAQRSTVLITASDITGPTHRPGIGPFSYIAGAGIGLDRTRLVISEGSAVRAGNSFSGSPLAGIIAAGSQIEVDPLSLMTGTNGGAGIVSNQPVVSRSIPALEVSAAGLGSVFSATISGPPASTAWLAISKPTPLQRTVFGDFGLDAASLLVAGTGVLGANRQATLKIPIPNHPQLEGIPIVAQSVVIDTKAKILLSLPVTVLLR